MKLRDRDKRIIMAAAMSLLVMLLSYLRENLDKPIGGETAEVKLFESLKTRLLPNSDKSSALEDCMMVNTSYDKQLIAKYDDYGFMVGNEAVSDRSLLADFIDLVAETDNYKALVFDLDMSMSVVENQDSGFVEQNKRLASLLAGMDRVVVSQSVDEQGHLLPLLDEALNTKSGVVSYVRTAKESEVVGVPLTSQGHRSVPLMMAELIDSAKMTRWGPFFFWNNCLCHKRVFPMDYWGISVGSNKEVQPYENLGSDIMSDRDMIPLRTEGKIIVVGDFVNDMHDTYKGTQPGSVILYNAYRSAVNKHHVVHWWWSLLLFLLYVAFSLSIMRPENDVKNEKRHFARIRRILEKKWVRFVLSFLGYTAILVAVKLIAFALLNIDYNIIVPGLCFGLAGNIYKTWKTK